MPTTDGDALLADSSQETMLRLLQQGTLEDMKQAFWSELSFDRVDRVLDIRGFPPSFGVQVGEAWLFARRGATSVLRLSLRQGFPINSRQVVYLYEAIDRRLPNTLMLLSDHGMSSWHLAYRPTSRPGEAVRVLPLCEESTLQAAARVLAGLALPDSALDDDGEGFDEAASIRVADQAFLNSTMFLELQERVEFESSGVLDYPVQRVWQRYRLRLLSADEERSIFTRLRGSEAAPGRGLRSMVERSMLIDRLVRHNVGLVFMWAFRQAWRANHSFEFMDAAQEGLLGLLRSFETFDHESGHKLSTYASWWIRQHIDRARADVARTIRLPVHVQDDLSRVRRAERQLWAEGHFDADSHWVARRAGVSFQCLHRVVAADEISEVLSLDAPLPGCAEDDHACDQAWGAEASAPDPEADDSAEEVEELLGTYDELTALAGRLWTADYDEPLSLLETIRSDGDDPTADEALAGADGAVVEQVMRRLTSRERQVLTRRFGLRGGEPETLEQVGERYGVTRERIRQIQSKALGKLESALRRGEWGEVDVTGGRSEIM